MTTQPSTPAPTDEPVASSAVPRLLRASTDADKELRRAAVLAAAAEVFAANGYHLTTIKDVARRAGVSYGLVYRYFDDKESLFHALLDERTAQLRRHIGDAMDAVAPPGTEVGGATVFRAAVRATFEFFETNRELVRLLFWDSMMLGHQFDRHVAASYEGFINDIAQVVAAAQADGEVVEAPPRMVAVAVAAQISQLALRRLETADGLTAADAADVVVRLLLEGLLPRREPSFPH